MLEAPDDQLTEKLIWTDKDYNLQQFVETFQLPQIVSVKKGYCGFDQRTTLGRDQILTLHQLRTTFQTVCRVENRSIVMLPSSCEIKAEVLPLECRDTIVTAKQLTETHRTIKYVRVLEHRPKWSLGDHDITFKENDIIEIQTIYDDGIHCKNLSTDLNIFLPSNCLAIFVPLLDPNPYTLANIKAKYGFPSKIRFIDKTDEEHDIKFVYGSRQFSTNMNRLGEIITIGEIQENDVIATTVCSNLEKVRHSMFIYR